MTEPLNLRGPRTDGDGTPAFAPVPIAVWHIPAGAPGETMSLNLAQRLMIHYLRGRRLVVDLTTGDQLRAAAHARAARYTHHRVASLSADPRRAALIVAGWPRTDSDPRALLQACAARLMTGSCLIVVLSPVDLSVNQRLITAARRAGLTYVQHIIAMPDRHTEDGDGVLPPHGDLLVFVKPDALVSNGVDG